MRGDIEDVPNKDKSRFAEQIKKLSRRLWMLFHNKEWFEEIVDSVDHRCHLRFNIPQEMNEFPFELLPLDESGDRRIGMLAPISRQLIKQGRYVTRKPLVLPREDGKRLKILVVAAESGGSIWLDDQGKVYQRKDDNAFTLEQLELSEEVKVLYQILTSRPDLIGEVTFLTQSNHIYETEQQGVKIRLFAPTAEAFEELLKTPNEQFDVLHFMGHSLRISDSPMKGGVLFKDRLMHLTQLAGLLKSQRQLCLAYLSCCESGVLDIDQRISDLSGLTQACFEAGVPAVLAMRWRITVAASRKLSEAFYGAFFETGALDQALHLAVQRVYDREYDLGVKVYAAAPMLIMH
jgi:hypothetical protein